jgi:hypothetical protein
VQVDAPGKIEDRFNRCIDLGKEFYCRHILFFVS